jgi:hypothetical protein
MTAEEARRACIEAAQMARANARTWRAQGEPRAADEAEKRAIWYRELARRRRNWR